MDGGKKSLRLSIYNQTFTLLVTGDPAALEQAALEVDELMTTIARTGNLDSVRVAILACLHLQDRVRSLETDFQQLKARIDDRTRQFTVLLDGAIEGES
jgi:cell division protein ZapA